MLNGFIHAAYTPHMKNNATAVWQGKGTDGQGRITTKSSVLNNVPYSYKTRFEGEAGTNPEELIAAAHAACFSMKLAFVLDAEGFTPTELNTNCEINFEAGVITGAHLSLKAKIPGIDKETFDDLVTNSGHNCPVSKVLNITPTISAELL